MAEGVVYIFSQDHRLYAVDRQTGQELWNFETNTVYSPASPTVADGQVYLVIDGQLYVLDGQTGREVWRFQLIPGANLTPVVTGDVVLVNKLFDLYAVQAPGL